MMEAEEEKEEEVKVREGERRIKLEEIYLLYPREERIYYIPLL